ncbi:MAG: hypothetical protein CVT92_14990 [Bacteroidetes bacterium HGW-Bacteroidetes-1]|jgi:hypothetical protein|nr:MAG: hypothetical protein CVT92_14990 [Bacteroidetes bacterium HGW-Bacteroidetes-1]
MKKRNFTAGFALLLIAMTYSSFAQNPSLQYFEHEIPQKANKELQFFAFFINQGVSSNFYPTNEFLRGQVVGRLFGQNTTVSSDTARSMYVEQRLIPFFIYQPSLFNGKAILRASFEIDWTWGDASYGTGGNLGGGLSADQVNIQTQNIEIELLPWKGWMINIGLQRMFDTPFNPYRTLFDKMTNTGYRLSYFGTDAVGLSIRHDRDFGRYKAGFYKFYENDIFRDDDVNMFEFVADRNLTPLWKAGASVYYVRDRSGGKGGISILGQGLNSLLNDYNGTFKFKFGTDSYKADIFWIGTFFSRNIDMMADPFSLSGFFNYNLGKADVLKAGTYEKGADIGGFAANLKGIYRYGQTTDDQLKVDLIYSSGDDNGINDKKYSGVMTGNTWGAPGAIFISSGTYILMPHGNVVNRYTPAIADISNMGYGMSAATMTISKGIIPNRLIARIGGGIAFSNVEPILGGKHIGTEGNLAFVYNLGTFMSIEWHTAHLWLGKFYDSADESHGYPINGGKYGERPVNPWTSFLVMKWLMF